MTRPDLTSLAPPPPPPHRQPIANADFIVPVEIDGTVHQVYVLKRPHVDAFLQKIGQMFECVLFTASLAKVSQTRRGSRYDRVTKGGVTKDGVTKGGVTIGGVTKGGVTIGGVTLRRGHDHAGWCASEMLWVWTVVFNVRLGNTYRGVYVW